MLLIVVLAVAFSVTRVWNETREISHKEFGGCLLSTGTSVSQSNFLREENNFKDWVGS